MTRFLFSLFLLLSFSEMCFAQLALNEVVIQDNKLSDKRMKDINLNKQIISKEDIRHLSVKNIGDVLQYVLGVAATRRGLNSAQTDLKINGGSFEQTLVMINGHAIMDAQTGHHLMNLPIDINDIEQIEILTGPQSHCYGINGVSGVINFVTLKVNKNEIYTNVNLNSNFRNDSLTGTPYASTQLHIGISHVLKHAKQYFSVSSDRGNGFMYNTQTKNYKCFYSNDIRFLKGHQLFFMASYIGNKFGANGFYAYPHDKNSIETVNTFFVAMNHEKKISKNLVLKSNISYRDNKDNYIFIKQNPQYYENNHHTKNYFANSNLLYQYKHGEFVSGLSYQVQHINSSNLGNFERNIVGAYLENRYKISSKLNTNAGLFWNYSMKWGMSILPGLDVGYDINDKLKFYATFGSANRLPTYTDLYYRGPSNIGNEHLAQEKSKGEDLGFKYLSKKAYYGVNVFRRNVKNFIDWTKDSNASIWQATNFGKQNVFGLQCYTQMGLSEQQYYSFRKIALQFQYNKLKIENYDENTVTKYVLDYYKHQLIGYLFFDFSKHFFVSTTPRYLNKWNDTHYFLMDLRMGYSYKHMVVCTDFYNMTNTQFRESNAMPMPKRWAALCINMKLGY